MSASTEDIEEWSPQGPVTELSAEHCWKLLNTTTLGRLGVSIDNQPEIFPVNYTADGASIIFRTAHGTKLRDLLINNTVVLEVDAQIENGAWSVTVKGAAAIIGPDAPPGSDADEFLPRWIPTEEFVYVRITPTEIRGRKFEHELRLIIHPA
ncbi:pyridoxamine 5'-phosphate oxidase family protein [Subtercola boreus]|uniref:pyridoxamine 5'-phosphate oxidase family protein n=1 Tax=Subtercola boreus TaxID=120213 RepID=UPI001558474E|nr:pyridoxamine 5'-phosphate oxidase family protein [Subtercola boreus]